MTPEEMQSPSVDRAFFIGPGVGYIRVTSFDEKKFFPSGAIAFFFALVALGLIIWFGIYFLMLERI